MVLFVCWQELTKDKLVEQKGENISPDEGLVKPITKPIDQRSKVSVKWLVSSIKTWIAQRSVICIYKSTKVQLWMIGKIHLHNKQHDQIKTSK